MSVKTTIIQEIDCSTEEGSGKMEATLKNNLIDSVSFHRFGTDEEDSITTTDPIYLRQVMNGLIKLFNQIDANNRAVKPEIMIQEETFEEIVDKACQADERPVTVGNAFNTLQNTQAI